MLNPTLNTKAEKPQEITENAKKLFQVVYNEENEKSDDDDDTPRLKVSELISKVAFYYEKIRNSVDYKEEHLLRKNAVLRILKRQIVIEGSIQEIKSVEISKHLLVELIRAAYLQNNVIPEAKIGEVAEIIDRYVKLRQYSLAHLARKDSDLKTEIVRFILGIAASEVEESLGRKRIDNVVINEMYETLLSRVKLPEDSPYLSDKEIQIYTGIHRNYLKFDNDMMGLILFRYYNGNWKSFDDKDIEKVGANILELRQAILDQINHPLVGHLNRVISRYSVYFGVLKEVIEDNPVAIYNNFKNDPKAFPRDIKKICNKKYNAARSKLWRAAQRSIIYIFLTKSIFAVALEVPATQFLGEPLNMYALTVNVAFPAALLFIMVLFTSLPSESNTQKIIEGINTLVFVDSQKKEPITLRPSGKRSAAMNSIFGLLYIVTFLVSVGFIVWILDKIGFNFVSITIFLFFLLFVSFFAIRIRKNAHEMIIIQSKENLFSFLADFFYIPIVAAGKWLSEKFSRINVFVFALDFIIEAPFKIFVEIAEEWTKYVKERRDQIV